MVADGKSIAQGLTLGLLGAGTIASLAYFWVAADLRRRSRAWTLLGLSWFVGFVLADLAQGLRRTEDAADVIMSVGIDALGGAVALTPAVLLLRRATSGSQPRSPS